MKLVEEIKSKSFPEQIDLLMRIGKAKQIEALPDLSYLYNHPLGDPAMRRKP